MGFDLLRGKVGAMVAVLIISGCALGLQVPVMPLYLHSLGIPGTVIGLILGTFGAALVAFEFAWGWWSDRVGIGLPLIITRSGLAVMMVGYGFVQPIPGFFLLQFGSGAFSCAIGPLSWSYFGHAIDPKRRGEAIALASTTMTLGVGIGTLSGGLLAELVGYRYVFFAAAAVATVSALVALITFHDVGPYRTAAAAAGGRPPVVLSSPTWIIPLAVVSTVTMLAWIGNSGERGFLPILAQARGLRTAEIGLVLTVLSSLTAIFAIPIGRLSDRFGRKPIIVGGIAIGAFALAAYSYADGIVALLAIACLRSVASASSVPVAIALLSVVTPAAVRGRVMGLYGSFEDVGIALGPAVSGVVWSNWGISAAFLVMAAFNLASLAAALALIHEVRWLKAVRPAMAGAS